MTYRFVAALFVALVVMTACQPEERRPISLDGTEGFYFGELAPFYHGVASGDPLPSSVIIWTRVTPDHHEKVRVRWEVARDSAFVDVVKKGRITTDSTRDYTVKVEVTELDPGSIYFFRFRANDRYSITGRTRTTPSAGSQEINLGIVSCSNYEAGYFAAYRHLAGKDVDAVLHLGDYFYEYGPGTYGDTTLNRRHIPPKEIVTLDEYRTRYAQYRLDNDLRKVHSRHPFITIWDDHEITNNSHMTGAQNHQDNEGNYEDRKKAAKKAYYEWMPVRSDGDAELYRSIDFGPLAKVIMLDERLTGRSEQAPSLDQVDSTLRMLGPTQLQWLKDELLASSARWNILGNQVIFSELDLSLVRPNSPKNLDAWDGYPYERQQILSFLGTNYIENLIIVTGDTHASWAFEIPRKETDPGVGAPILAAEFGTTSITSANWNESNSDPESIVAEGLILTSNENLKYVNGRDHGYLILTLTDYNSTATWYYMDDIRNPNSGESVGKRIILDGKTGHLSL